MRNWPVAPVVGIEPLAGGQTPVYRVDTADGDAWVLKDRGTLEHARLLRLAFDAGVMRHLDEAGVAVPVLQPDRDGRLWVAEGGRAWTLARYLPAGGGRKTDGEHRRWWANVGRALATLHLALATYPVDDGVLDVTWREDLPSRLTAETEVAMEKLDGSELDRFRAAASAVLEPALSSLHGLPEQLIHRDAHPGNIVSDGPRVVGFVDCDHFCLAPPVFDLAYFAVHMVKWSVGDPEATEVWLDRLPTTASSAAANPSSASRRR